MEKFEVILENQRQEFLSVDKASLISRKEEQQISLDSKLAQVVIGVRRSGKSTLCQKVLLESGVKFAYINFDDENLAGLQVEQLNDIEQLLYRIYGDFSHLFIDEVQNIPRWQLFVNRLLRQGLHILLTGSNANLLSEELATHLTGRYNEIRLFPFSFLEYCIVKKVNIENRYTKAIGLREHALDEYLLNGGFPETLHEEWKSSDSAIYTRSLLNTIINKDIRKRYKIRYQTTLNTIANTILDTFCQELNFETIRSQYQVKSVQTVKNYVSFLEQAFLVRILHKYSYKSVERQTGQKSYVVDNSFISNRENALQPQNLGWRLENAIAIELLRRQKYADEQLYYLKDNNRFEVDFVLTERNLVTELIQVTYDFSNPTTKQYNREIGGLIKASAQTHCDNLTLIMMYGEAGERIIDGKIIHCELAMDWLLRQ